MKIIIRLAVILSMLGFASTLSAATVTFSIVSVESANTAGGRQVAPLRFYFNSAHLKKRKSFPIDFRRIAEIDVDLGGRENKYSFGLTRLASELLRHRWNKPFPALDQLNLQTPNFRKFSLRTDPEDLGGFKQPSVSNFSTSQIVVLPLPASFPMLLGACLAAALFARSRRQYSV